MTNDPMHFETDQPPEPFRPDRDELHVLAWVFAALAVLMAILSVASGVFNGKGFAAILFAAAAIAAFWEDARGN